MSYCSKCGVKLDEDVRFCPKCGSPVGPAATGERREIGRGERRPISTLAVVLIVIVVVGAVATGVLLLLWRGGWVPWSDANRIVGSGNVITQTMDYSDFTVVEVGWAFEVEITQSGSYSVSITADDNLFDYIEVSQTEDKLTIGLKSGYSYGSAWPWARLTLRAEIGMPELYELELTGATRGTVVGFSSSHEFVLVVSGASSLNGDFTTSGDAQFTVSGASSVELEGAANDLTVNGEGASRLELSAFPVHDATVNLSGASRATVNLDGRLEGDVSGASHLLYMGSPTAVEVDTSGGSSVGPK